MSWINAGFLFGFAALAVPVLIHLIHSRRHRTAFLGSIRFVLEAMREQRRRRRLRELLLLLARLGIVALLVLLFARPFQRDPLQAEKKPPQYVILLDASGSQDSGSLGTRNFDLAWDEARRIVAQLPEDAKCKLAAFSDRVVEVTQTVPCGGPTRYAAALGWAAGRFTVPSPRGRGWDEGDGRVVLITDMQESGLPAEPLADWPLGLPVEIVALPESGDWNAAITDVRPAGEYFAEETELLVQVKFCGHVPEGTRRVKVEVEGETLAAETAPHDGLVRLPWHPSRPGLFRGTARLDSSDAWPRDDERPFAFVLAPVLPILLVDGEPGDSPYQEETYYLQTALAVSESDDHRSQFRVEHRTRLGDPTDFSVVALCNVAGLSEAETRILETQVKSGTGLVYFLGDRVDERAYRRLQAAGLFPADVQVLDAPITRPIFNWNTQHSALALFHDHSSALTRIQFREALRLAPDKDAAVLARQSDGSPALLTGFHGKGRIVVVANPADRDWSDWPQERIYLPVVRELLRYADQTEKSNPAIEHRLQGMDEERAPGVYRGGNVVVVAPHPDEADPLACDPATFRARLGIGEAPEPLAEAQAQIPPPPGSERKREWWPWVALALLGLLWVENLLADGGRP